MSDLAHGAGAGPRDRMVFAVVLIAVGVIGLLTQIFKPATDLGGWIVLVIGLGLLGAFVYTRAYGYLVPGGIMTGLGAGIIVSEVVAFPNNETASGAIVLGLGLGFVSIWVIGALLRVAQHHWWPLIPGGILVAVGAALLIGGQAVRLLDYWGAAIIVIGVLILLRSWSGGRARS